MKKEISSSSKKIKIISWNVNGLRAVWKKGALQKLVEQENPDIFVLQETKCTPDQLTDEMKNFAGYISYFESSSMRKGYSGVAIYTKSTPIKVTNSILTALGEKHPRVESEESFQKLDDHEKYKIFLDNEGRTLVAEYQDFYLMNCYWPNGGKSEEHYHYKLAYYDKTLKLMQKLEKKKHKRVVDGAEEIFCKPVIFTGDINATVADIDLARPKDNKDKLGCTKPERDRLAKFIENFVDSYRKVNGDKVQYTWWDMKTSSRAKNVGWRIDYFFTSKSLEDKILDAKIMDDFFGSDHCPVMLELKSFK